MVEAIGLDEVIENETQGEKEVGRRLILGN